MTDLKIIETGSGGDLQIRANDIAIINGYENLPYLGIFGFTQRPEGWWANSIIYTDEPRISLGETALKENTLSSNGRLNIQKAIEQDIQRVTASIPNTTYSVNVILAGHNRIDIEIEINGTVFSANWNPETQQLIII